MKTTNKKTLLIMTYYTLMILMVALAVFFLIGLNDRIAMWARIGYYILTALFVALIVFDIVCTNSQSLKYMAGFILYALTIVTVIMAFIVYSRVAVGYVIDPAELSTFLFEVMLSGLINILSIIIYCAGQHLVTITSHQQQTKETKSLTK